jgi:hypothetical protein
MAGNAGSMIIELTAETAKLRASMNEASKILKDFGVEAGKVGKVFSKVFDFAIPIGIIGGIMKLTKSLGEMAAHGDKANEIADLFERLGGTSSSINAASAALNGVVAKTELMRISSRGLLAGIPNLNQNFAKLAELGDTVGVAMGTDAAQGFESLIEAIARGKAGQLAQLGIFVDAKDKAGRMAQIMKQAGDVQKGLGSSTDTAGKAFERFELALSSIPGTIGKLLARSEALKAVFDNLAIAAREVAKGIDYAFSEQASTKLARLEDLQRGAKEVIKRYPNSIPAEKATANIAQWEAEKKILQLELDQNAASGKALAAQIEENRKLAEAAESIEKAAEESKKLRDTFAAKEFEQYGERIQTALTAAITQGNGEAFGQLIVILKDHVAQGVIDGFGDAYNRAPNELRNQIQSLADKEATIKADSWLKKQSEAQEEIAKKSEEINKQLAEKQKQAYKDSVDFWRNAFENAITGSTYNLKDSLNQLAIGFSAEILAKLGPEVPGGVKSIKDLGGAIAVKFVDALGLNSSLFGTSESEARANGLQGPAMENGQFSKGENSQVAQSVATGMAIGAQLIDATINAHSIDSKYKDNRGTGSAVGGGIGAIIGGYFGGPQGAALGAQIGGMAGDYMGRLFKWGSQNPETNARHGFANFIEEGFKKLKSITFMDMATGKYQTTKGNLLNYMEGDRSRFNEPGWGDAFNKSPTASVFSGLAEGMKQLLGITEDVAGQMAVVLSENLGGSINNARLLVYQLGISFEDMEQKLVEAGKSGSLTWLEVESAIQNATEAFKPGLVGIGDMKGAYDELLGSAGRGTSAIKGIKDIAQETLEAGGKSLDDIKNKLVGAGISEEEANAIVESIKGRGITTIQELLNMSDRTAGAIIADINAKSESIAAAWSKAQVDFESQNEQLDMMKQKMEAIPTEVNSNIKLNFTSNVDETTQKVLDSTIAGKVGITLPATTATTHANGGIISNPSYFMSRDGLHLAGEAGPEAILPLQSVNGKLGVRAVGKASSGVGNGSGYVINIDASNSAPGVEHQIRRAIEDSQWTIVNKVMDMLQMERGR